MPTNTDRVVVRLSPNYSKDYTLYAVEVDENTTIDKTFNPNANLLEFSTNRGNTWSEVCIPRPVIDFIATGQYTLYLATTGGCIRKSEKKYENEKPGQRWGDMVQTGLNDINMLAASDTEHIFAGSRDGWVAYSTDGGASFTKINEPVSLDMTDVQVVPDTNYASNGIIYESGRTSDGIDAGVW